MRPVLILLVSLLSSATQAIGWEEVSKSDIEKFNISVVAEFSQSWNCYDFKVKLPTKMSFPEMGSREFASARYIVVSDKQKGWQLNALDTSVLLPMTVHQDIVKLKEICLSAKDLKTAYISALYAGPKGVAPIVVLLQLGEFP